MRILMEVFRCKGRTQDSRIGLKVSVVDGLDELLCDLYDLLLASCGAETQGGDEEDSNRAEPCLPPDATDPEAAGELTYEFVTHC